MAGVAHRLGRGVTVWSVPQGCGNNRSADSKHCGSSLAVHSGRIAVGLALVMVMVSLFGCSSSSSDGSSTATTSGLSGKSASGRSSDGLPQDWSTDTTIPEGDAVYLIANWQIDIRDLIASGAKDQSGVPEGVICEGMIRLTFLLDGTFTQTGKPKCEQDGQFRTAEVNSTGRWKIAGDRLQFSDVVSKGQIYLVKGIDPFTPGLVDGVVVFEIADDTLTISGDNDHGSTWTQQWSYADPA